MKKREPVSISIWSISDMASYKRQRGKRKREVEKRKREVEKRKREVEMRKREVKKRKRSWQERFIWHQHLLTI
jgi:hypothetical protein